VKKMMKKVPSNSEPSSFSVKTEYKLTVLGGGGVGKTGTSTFLPLL
jgi:GTPase SAR1 family protein